MTSKRIPKIVLDGLDAPTEEEFKRRVAEKLDELDERDAYELSDPKHPEFHDNYAELWDSREGK